MKNSFLLLSPILGFQPREDGKFQLKVNDNTKWTNQCIALQSFHKPGGFNLVSGQYESMLPAAVLTDCNILDQNQWFEYDVTLQLKANGKCLSFGQYSTSETDPCAIDETQLTSAQLYSISCISVNNLAQKWVFRNGSLQSLCSHGYSVSAEASLNEQTYENLSEFLTVPLMLADVSNTKDLVTLSGLEAAFNIPMYDKISSMSDMLYMHIGEHELDQHGCYCSVLDAGNDYAHKGSPLDPIDAICKEWWEAIHCTGLSGGSCHERDLIMAEYTYYSGNACSLNNDACFRDRCLVDVFFAERLKTALTDSHSIIQADPTTQCIWNGDITGNNECSGSAPNLQINRM